MRAKKSLGQNFLKSESVVKKIVEVGQVALSDLVLEIGPGKGILTKALLETGAEVVAVEKDDELFKLLRTKFKDKQKLRLIHGDVLKINLGDYLDVGRPSGGYKLIANIPYNITGEVLRRFLERENQPSLMVLLLQYEVAKRIVAKGGKESVLSISVKAYGEPKYIEKVKKELFSPAPRVNSAILLIKNISKDFFKAISEKDFFDLLKRGFAHKRKKLLNNLREKFLEDISEAFEKLGIDKDIRAERLTKDDWKKLLQIAKD